MTYSGYILGFVLIVILLVITVCLLRSKHDSYLRYVDSFLMTDNCKILDKLILNKLYCMFRSYFVLGAILGVAFALIKSNYILSFTPNYFYLYFLSSCFFLFIARTYTTTDIISSVTNDEKTSLEKRDIRIDRIRRHMSHINFLAFFGMITGVLGLIISLVQYPETIIVYYEKVFLFEIGISKYITETFIIVMIPFIFSLGEIVLILIRNYRTTA